MVRYLSQLEIPDALLVVAFCFAAMLFVVSIGCTASCLNGSYSVGAVVLYWIYFGITIGLLAIWHVRFAFHFFIWCAPFVAGVMYSLEHFRKHEMSSSIHNEKPTNDGRI